MTAISIKTLRTPIHGRAAFGAFGVGMAAVVLAVLVGSLLWDRSPWISIVLGTFVAFSSAFANWLTIYNAKFLNQSRFTQLAGFLWMLVESLLMVSLLWMRLSN